jgi:hypothetical protein
MVYNFFELLANAILFWEIRKLFYEYDYTKLPWVKYVPTKSQIFSRYRTNSCETQCNSPDAFLFRERSVTEPTVRGVVRVLQPGQVGLDHTLHSLHTFKFQSHTLRFQSVLGILIRRIRTFLGLSYPHSDPFVISTDPLPSSRKNNKKNLDFYCFVTSL